MRSAIYIYIYIYIQTHTYVDMHMHRHVYFIRACKHNCMTKQRGEQGHGEQGHGAARDRRRQSKPAAIVDPGIGWTKGPSARKARRVRAGGAPRRAAEGLGVFGRRVWSGGLGGGAW